jgi:predicted nucleotidyltransferase
LYRSSGYSNHLHPSVELGRLDFVYVRGETRNKLFASAREVPLAGGLRVRVPRPEHLAAMKIQAMKNDPERTLQELADIQFLLRLPGVDEEEIRGYFEKQGLLEKFDEIKRGL